MISSSMSDSDLRIMQTINMSEIENEVPMTEFEHGSGISYSEAECDPMMTKKIEIANSCHFYSTPSQSVFDIESENEDEYSKYDLQNREITSTFIHNEASKCKNRKFEIPKFSYACCGACFFIKRSGQRVILISMEIDQQILIGGVAYIKPLLGCIDLHGYTLKQYCTVPVFAPNTERCILVQGRAVCSKPSHLEDESPDKWTAFENTNVNETLSTKSAILDYKFKEYLFEHYSNFTEKKWNLLNLEKASIKNEFIANHIFIANLVLCKTMNFHCSMFQLLGKEAIVLEVRQFPNTVLELCANGYLGNLKNRNVCSDVVIRSSGKTNALTRIRTKKYRFKKLPVYFPESWKQTVAALYSKLLDTKSTTSKDMRIMILTEKEGAGRRTFVRFLINTLLSAMEARRESSHLMFNKEESVSSSSKVNNHGVYLMDLDVRHPELSITGTVCLARCTVPFIGPAWTYGVAHEMRKHTSFTKFCGKAFNSLNDVDFGDLPFMFPEVLKTYFIGQTDLLILKDHYLSAVASLVKAFRAEKRNEPLVVTCSPKLNKVDFIWQLEVMKLVNPTHVIHISGTVNCNYKKLPLKSAHINERIDYFCTDWYYHSQYTDDNETISRCKYLNYDYARIPSVSRTFKIPVSSDYFQKNMRLFAYFSALWPHYAFTIDETFRRSCVEVKLKHFALHVKHFGLPYERLLNSFLARKLVALCHLNSKHIKDYKLQDGPVIRVVDKVLPEEPILRKRSQIEQDYINSSLNECSRRLNDDDSNEIYVDVFDSDQLFEFYGWAIFFEFDLSRQVIRLLVPGCLSVLSSANCLVQGLYQPPVTSLNQLLYPGHVDRPYESIAAKGSWNIPKRQRTN